MLHLSSSSPPPGPRYTLGFCPPGSAHCSHGTQPNLRRNFARRHHGQTRHQRLQPALHVVARRTGAQEHGQSRRRCGTDKGSHRIGEPAQQRSCGRSQTNAISVRELPAALFPVRVLPEHLLRATDRAQRRAFDLRRQASAASASPHRLANRFHQVDRILVRGASTITSSSDPRSRMETCSRNNCCSTRCTSPSVISFGTSSSISLGASPASSSRLVSARPRSRGLATNQLSQMGGNHRHGIHHGITRGHGLFFQRWLNPARRHSKGRLSRFFSRQRPPAGSPYTASSCLPSVCQRPISIAQRDQVLPRLQPQIVRDVHGRDQKAQLRQTGAGAAPAPGSAAALPAFRPPAESAENRFQASDRQDATAGPSPILRLLVFLFLCGTGRDRDILPPATGAGLRPEKSSRDHKKWDLRQPRNQAKPAHTRRPDRAWPARQQLLPDLAAKHAGRVGTG